MRFRLSDSRISLRTRFALGLGAVLLPFLVAAAVGQFYLPERLIEPLEDIVREFTEKLEPVTHLQQALLQAAMPVNDYLIHGDLDERRQFAELRQRVERAFGEASPERFTLAENRALIGVARAEWEQALLLGEQLLRLPDPVGNAVAAHDMERFDAHIDRAVSALGEAHVYFHRVIERNRVQAGATHTRAKLAALAVLGLAFGISLFVSLMLSRPVVTAVDALGKATALLAGGNLSARVVVDRKDEFGQLALAFNSMAGKLEKNEAALRALATRDGLTGLYNHRTFYALLGDELARAQRFERPLSLLLLDIDHFKRVNDTRGHLAGDAALRGLGELLGREARAIDRVCRYGGEEIVLILPETDPDAAVRFAERLRAAVEAQPFDANSEPIRMTVSIGVASFPAHADGAEALVASADAAMYAAKQGGRNRVVRYGAQPASTG